MKTCMMIIAFGYCMFCSAQRVYTIGDKVPDLQFPNLLNSKTTTTSLSQLRGKVTLIDFWSTRCGACVASMPKLSALKKKFKSNLEIMLVTIDSIGMVESFFKKRPYLKELGLPVSCNDQTIKKLFPHKSVPHVVWMNEKNEIAAITGSNEVTEQNIESLLKGNKLNLPQKWEYMDYSPDVPLFNTLATQEKQVRISTLLTEPIEGIPAGIAMVKNEYRRKVVAKNMTLRYILPFVFRQNITIPPFEYKHRVTSNQDSLIDQRFCFELLVPSKHTETELLQITRRNLEQMLSFTSTIEKQKMQCYIIRPSDSFTKHNRSGTSDIRETDEYVELVDYNIRHATGYMNMYSHSAKFFVYEGDLSNTITMAISKKKAKRETLFSILKAHGYEISEEEREIEIIRVKFD